jgi:hypothetical protein
VALRRAGRGAAGPPHRGRGRVVRRDDGPPART